MSLDFLDNLIPKTDTPGADLSFLDEMLPESEPAETDPRECETASVPHRLRHVRRSTKRQFLNALQVDEATAHIRELPGPGESLHCIVNAKFKGFDIIPATLRLIEPQVIDELVIATLSFSRDNALDLLRLIDAGKVKSCWFMASVYFAKSDADIFNMLADELKARGHRMLATRNHAKICLMRTSDGRHFTVESSSNLRSCYTVEQFALVNDPDLYAFHREWIVGAFDV